MKGSPVKRRVVLVDDETGLLQMFEDILSDTYQVIPFNSPQLFLKYLDNHKETPFEILMTDLKMPGMTGVEMIRRAQQKGFFFPSILLSGYLDKQAVVDAVDLGVFRLLEKPTSPDVVIQSMEELIVEYDVRDVRKEIHQITKQLREYYSFLRVLLATRVPEAEINNFALQTNSKGEVVSQESFDGLLDRLEGRMEKLLKSETTLQEMRSKRYKNIA